MSAEDLARLKMKVAGVHWYHSMDLGHGITTPGKYAPAEWLPRLNLPNDLRGRTVLDIGAWDGFFSFEAERRGAGRVLATDSFCWSGEGWGSKAGFELARTALGSKVEDRDIEVLDLSPEEIGTFDIVLFLGVLYHMKHPLLALERTAAVTKDLLVLQTHVVLEDTLQPVMVFYPGKEFNEDYTNWWVPNRLAVEAMLKTVGFKRIECVSKTAWGEPYPNNQKAWTVVYHARR